jgi:hypothetical protein
MDFTAGFRGPAGVRRGSQRSGDAGWEGSGGTGSREADAHRTPGKNALRNPFGDGFFGASARRTGLRQTAKPLILRFLFGPKRMLAGLARKFASDSADFLGSHPEAAGIHRR